MKYEKLLDLIGQIDDDLILGAAEVAPIATAPKQARTASSAKRKWLIALAAALLCIALLAGVILPALLKGDKNDPTPEPKPDDLPSYKLPEYADAYLSAEDLENMFPEYLDATTSTYKELHFKDGELPVIPPLPTGDSAAIYKLNPLQKPLSEAELLDFKENIIYKLLETTSLDINDFKSKKLEGNTFIQLQYENLEPHATEFYFEQEKGMEEVIRFNLNSVWIWSYKAPLTIDRKPVTVDLSKSHEEILSSLEWVRDELFEVFGRSFDNAKITSYSTSLKNGFTVYYYNENGTPFMEDYISISFEPFKSSSGSDEAQAVLGIKGIAYHKYRIDIEEWCEIETEAKLIPLEEAEKMVANGYTFGGHMCELCMAGQEKVSFSEYDYVGFEYLTNYDSLPSRSIPFYTFYKKIKTEANGITAYAKAYVCAVEISGLQEYFDNQIKDHKTS